MHVNFWLLCVCLYITVLIQAFIKKHPVKGECPNKQDKITIHSLLDTKLLEKYFWTICNFTSGRILKPNKCVWMYICIEMLINMCICIYICVLRCMHFLYINHFQVERFWVRNFSPTVTVLFIFLQKWGSFYIYIIWNKRDNSLPTPCTVKTLWRANSSLEPTTLCGRSLDRAWRILSGMRCVYWGHDDV